jgi:hypothetical protein
MSSFPSASTQYDPADVDAQIADFRAELADEKALAATLDDTAADQKLADATAFLTNNSPLVDSQLTELKSLDGELRAIVDENKRRVAKDKAYDDLINSQPYLALADKLLELKTTAKALHQFLVDAGVRGQPRARSAPSTKSANSQ